MGRRAGRSGTRPCIREATRDAWGWGGAERGWQDTRYALRMMRRNPGFSAVAILTLALGIAATTAILTVVNALVLRALPYPDADRLVLLFATTPKKGVARDTTSFLDVPAWQQSRALSATAVYRLDAFILSGEGQPQPLPGLRVSDEFLARWASTRPWDGASPSRSNGRRCRWRSSATACGPGAMPPTEILSRNDCGERCWPHRVGVLAARAAVPGLPRH